jgi:hypothetical protein
MRKQLAAALTAVAIASIGLPDASAAQTKPGCLATSSSITTLTGTSRTDFSGSGIGIDARAVTWTGTDPFLVHLEDGSNVCWLGGKINGTWDQQNTVWDTYHSTAAFYVYSDNTSIEDVRIHNYGDGIRTRDPVKRWAVRRSYISDNHDDAFENEDHSSLVLEDNLIEGTYVAISTRNSDSSVDGSGNLIEVRKNLIQLKSFAHNYKEQVGYQGVFKYDKDGRGPKVAMHDNVILAVGQKNSSGITFAPYVNKTVSCSGNKLLYLGTQTQFNDAMSKGDGPDGMEDDAARIAELNRRFPGCFTVTLKPSTQSDKDFLDQQGWNKNVLDWKASHLAAGGTPSGSGDTTTPPAPTAGVPQAPILLP